MVGKVFIIQDWAGNRLFPNKTFPSYEDGWEYIYTNVPNEDYNLSGNENDNVYQDLFVLPI
jgi:hypothetical protein